MAVKQPGFHDSERLPSSFTMLVDPSEQYFQIIFWAFVAQKGEGWKLKSIPNDDAIHTG